MRRRRPCMEGTWEEKTLAKLKYAHEQRILAEEMLRQANEKMEYWGKVVEELDRRTA